MAVSDETRVAGAFEASVSVDASSVVVAVVLHGHALVDISAFFAVASEAIVASADESTVSVGAAGVGIAGIIGSTLIDISTALAISEPSSVAFTGEGSSAVLAGSIGVTIVRSLSALVNVIAGESITREASST